MAPRVLCFLTRCAKKPHFNTEITFCISGRLVFTRIVFLLRKVGHCNWVLLYSLLVYLLHSMRIIFAVRIVSFSERVVLCINVCVSLLYVSSRVHSWAVWKIGSWRIGPITRTFKRYYLSCFVMFLSESSESCSLFLLPGRFICCALCMVLWCDIYAREACGERESRLCCAMWLCLLLNNKSRSVRRE